MRCNITGNESDTEPASKYITNTSEKPIHNGRTQWLIYSVFQKSDAKIQITITTAYVIRIKYPLGGFNYHLSGVNAANFNKILCTVYEQQLFKKELKNRSFQYGKYRLAYLLHKTMLQLTELVTPWSFCLAIHQISSHRCCGRQIALI